MHVPDPLQAAINWLSMLVLPILLLIFNAAASTLAGVAVRAAAVRAVLGALCGWVQIYSRLLDECEREIRRADFRRDLLWGRYRRLRRRGYAGADLAIQLLMPVIKDMPSDFAEAVSTFAAEQTAVTVYRLTVGLAIVRRRTGRLIGTPDRIALQRALDTLADEHGYFINADRHALACCSNCGWNDVPDRASGAVFWCIQSDGYSFDGDAGYCDDGYSDWLRHTLYIQWSGNGRLIVKTLREAGFQVRWNGRRTTGIAVLPSARHADPACDSAECRPARSRRGSSPPPTKFRSLSADGASSLWLNVRIPRDNRLPNFDSTSAYRNVYAGVDVVAHTQPDGATA